MGIFQNLYLVADNAGKIDQEERIPIASSSAYITQLTESR